MEASAVAFDAPPAPAPVAGAEPYRDPTVLVADAPAERDSEHTAPVSTYGYPILTSGSADPCVVELGRKLGDLGFENTASRGENPYGHVDQSVMAAVRAFRSVHGVQEDSDGFGGDHPAAHTLADSHIGWRTWAKLNELHEARQ